MPIIDQLGRNLQFSAYARLVVVLNSLYLTPYILNHVDPALFGLNALVVSIVGYFNIFDFGLGAGIARYTAVFSGQRRAEMTAAILRFGVLFFSGLGVVVWLSMLLLTGFYERLFHIDLQLVRAGRFLLMIHAFSALAAWPLIPFRAMLNGMQRIDIINKISLIVSLLNIPIAISVLGSGGSYLFYIAVIQAAGIIFSLPLVISVLRRVGRAAPRRIVLPSDLQKQLFSYSSGYFLSGIIGILIFQIDHTVIAAVMSVTAVTHYAVAYTIHNYIRSMNGIIGSSLFTILIAEYAGRTKDNRNAMIVRITRMHAGVLLPMVAITTVFAEKFIVAWVGASFQPAVLPCRILIGYWFCNISTEILFQGVVGGEGRVYENLRIESVVAVLNLLLSLWLVHVMGIAGVAIGTSAPYVLASGVYVYRFCRILGLPVMRYLGRGLLPNLPHVAVALLLSALLVRSVEAPHVMAVVAMMASVYLASLGVGYAALSGSDRAMIRGIMKPRL